MPVCDPSRTEGLPFSPACVGAAPIALLSNRLCQSKAVLLSAALLVRVAVFVSLDGWNGCQAAPNCRPWVRLGIVPGRGWEGMHDLVFGDFAAAARNLDASMLRHDSTVPYRTAPHCIAEGASCCGRECYAVASSLAGSAISVAGGQPHPSLWAGCMLRLTGGRASRTTCLLLGACVGLGLLYHILRMGYLRSC